MNMVKFQHSDLALAPDSCLVGRMQLQFGLKAAKTFRDAMRDEESSSSAQQSNNSKFDLKIRKAYTTDFVNSLRCLEC